MSATRPEVLTESEVLVVGGGNAGFSAAHAAAERGRRVLLLE
jgi:tricarballylate dehydrogenase